MQVKKLEKMVKNIETTLSQQKRGIKMINLNKSLIKKAQNLITNGPKNINTPQTQKILTSRPAPQLRIDKNLNQSLNKSQDSKISSVTKHSNHNISPSFSQKSSNIFKEHSQTTVKRKVSNENKFGALTNREIQKKVSKTPQSLKKATIEPRKPLKKIEKPFKIPPKSNEKLKSSVSQGCKIQNYQKTLSRFEVYNQLKTRNLNELRLKFRNEELSNTSSHSFISKNSSKILKDKAYKPPYQKTDEVLKHKKQSICNIQQKISKENAIKNPEPSFHPIITQSNTNRRTQDEFYKGMVDWMRQKKERNAMLELELKQNETSQTTFHPEIDYNSNHIANEMEREKHVEVRLNNWKKNIEEKKNVLFRNAIPNFTPKILENSQGLARSYREKMKSKQEENQEDDNENEDFEKENYENNKKKNASVSFNLEIVTVEEFQTIECQNTNNILEDAELNSQKEENQSKKESFSAINDEIDII